MKIAFLVSKIETEQPDYTTTRLAMAAAEAGHEAFYVDLDGVSYSPDERLKASVHRVPDETDLPYDSFLERMRDKSCIDFIDVTGLDVLMLRHEPELDVVERPWTQGLGLAFGEMAAQRGVIVLNDPAGFARAINKLYMQDFPSSIRPKTLITRDEEEAKKFIEALGGEAVVKPLQSGKGEGVFLVRRDEDANLNQMIEAVKQHGYLVVQEYLPAAGEGDVRLLLMNGEPLKVDGQHAAVFRKTPEDDMRANISTGAAAEPAEVSDDVLRIAEAVRPKLVKDGMFFVGLDIAGDKLIEINGTSPGTLTSSQWTTGVDYGPALIEAIEKKVELAASNGDLSNVEIATASG